MKDNDTPDAVQERIEEVFEAELKHDRLTIFYYWLHVTLYFLSMGAVTYAFFLAGKWLSFEWCAEPGVMPYTAALLGAVTANFLQSRPNHRQCWKTLSNVLFEANLDYHENDEIEGMEPWCGIVVNAKVYRLLAWNPVTRQTSGARVYVNVWAVDPIDKSSRIIFSDFLESLVGSPKTLMEHPYLMGWSEEVKGLDPDRKYILKIEARNDVPIYAPLLRNV